MARRNALVLVLALVAVGALLWTWRDAPVGRTMRRDAPEAAPVARRAASTVTPEEPAAPAPDEDAAEDPTAPLPDGDRIPLRGTIVVVDENGVEHAQESGVFTLWSYRDGSGTGAEVEVESGRWEAAVVPGDEMRFGGIELGKRLAFTATDFRVPFPADGIVAVRAHWPPRARLAVVAAATGEPLDDVVVAGIRKWMSDTPIHPGADPEIVARGRSPVVLPEDDGVRRYWARAPGYAWGPVEFDHRTAGEREVRLAKGGALEIELVNFDPESAAVARFYGEGRRPLLEVKPESATVRLDHLPPRAFSIRVEIGHYWRDPERLGEAEVEIVAGGSVKVRVVLRPWKRPDAVPLEGRLVVPEAWGDVVPYLIFREPEGAPEPKVELREGRWNARPAVPGRYVVTVFPFCMQFVLDVGPSGLVGARLAIPEPADVVVTVLDADTGKPANVESVHWNVARPEGVTGGSLEGAERDPKTGAYVFRAPVGEVDIAPWDDFHDSNSRRVELRPGRNEVTFRVRRNCGVHIVLKDGDATVPFGFDLEIEFEDLDGDGEEGSRSGDDVTSTIRLTRPGRYRITFGRVEGFAPIPPRVVTVGPGETLAVEVALERAK